MTSRVERSQPRARDRAESLYERFLELVRELDDRESIAIVLLNLAMVSTLREDRVRAREMLLGALAIVQETGSKPAGQSVLEVCAGLASRSSDWPRAARFYGAAEAQAVRSGLRRDPADEAFLRPLVSQARAQLGDARFTAAEQAGRALADENALGEAREWLKGLASYS